MTENFVAKYFSSEGNENYLMSDNMIFSMLSFKFLVWQTVGYVIYIFPVFTLVSHDNINVGTNMNTRGRTHFIYVWKK